LASVQALDLELAFELVFESVSELVSELVFELVFDWLGLGFGLGFPVGFGERCQYCRFSWFGYRCRWCSWNSRAKQVPLELAFLLEMRMELEFEMVCWWVHERKMQMVEKLQDSVLRHPAA
jgi:hypothetical protein